MAKSLMLGNGSLLIGLDRYGQVRDLYFPYVGLENHMHHTNTHRIGVFADGRLSWFNSGEWHIEVMSEEDTFIGVTRARNDSLGVEIKIRDAVHNQRNALVREIEVINLKKEVRDIKIFFGHEFQISETRRGNTAFFDPRAHALIHYKGNRAFLINAMSDRESFDDYTVGLFDTEGKEGSHRDAEDGELSKNPIEHGHVDSVLGQALSLPSDVSTKMYYWMVVGKSVAEVRNLNEYVLKRKPAFLLKATKDFWTIWVNKRNFTFFGLTKEQIELFKKSLFVLRAHADDGGAIIASGDSDMLQHGRDTYAYCWPRDASFSARALARAGEFNVSQRFYNFMKSTISRDGYFMHKYRPDGSLGSSWHPWVRDGKTELPIQEDETALVVWGLWNYYELSKDLEFIEEIYNSLIKKSAEFLVSFTHKDTGLSYSSYDLWEEHYGVGMFSITSKYGALKAAADFAELLGKNEDRDKYSRHASEIKDAILEYLYNEKDGTFFKRVDLEGKSEPTPDATLDSSSLYGLWRFGVLSPDDERVRKFADILDERLLLKEGTIGGMPRYAHDGYFRISEHSLPNPWIITTLWRAQYLIAIAESEEDMKPVKDILQWVVDRALPSGMLPEQVNLYTGEPLSATPLAWSHAEYVSTVVDYLEKLEELGVCDACYTL